MTTASTATQARHRRPRRHRPGRRQRVDAGDVPGISLAAVSVRDEAKARKTLAGIPLAARASPTSPGSPMRPTSSSNASPPPSSLRLPSRPSAAGRIFMPLSVGALLDHMPLVDLARETGARIIVPTGALLGLDAVRAAAEGQISSVRIVTRKPPAGLAGAPLLVERGISVDGLKEPLRVFEGSAREAIAGFPANVNVAVALSLAGIGPDRTQVEIWADPGVTRNTHTIIVKSDASDLTMTIENVPSEENPRTGPHHGLERAGRAAPAYRAARGRELTSCAGQCSGTATARLLDQPVDEGLHVRARAGRRRADDVVAVRAGDRLAERRHQLARLQQMADQPADAHGDALPAHRRADHLLVGAEVQRRRRLEIGMAMRREPRAPLEPGADRADLVHVQQRVMAEVLDAAQRPPGHVQQATGCTREAGPRRTGGRRPAAPCPPGSSAPPRRPGCAPG